MVQHNIYLKPARAPYFTFDESAFPLRGDRAQQLQEIGRQCLAIARLNAEDWRQIGMVIAPIATDSLHRRVRRPFFPSLQVFPQAAIAIGQCLKLLTLQNEDWQNMTNWLSRD
ncbi:MAG: hypothetical protein J7647_19270 [Cyanobacteria bacterium SBLK]|nr:hypothetical protein [Cyanobacteria bacterium SBLK]